MKIVLTDDDAQMREMLTDFLSGKYPEAQITAFSSGEETINKVNEEPDLAILDYNLDSINAGAINGLQVFQKLKEKYPKLPVIFLSGQDRAGIAANIIKFGAWDYVIKNENAFQRLEILIGKIFGNSQLEKNLGAQKFFNRLLVFIIIGLLIGFFIMKMG